MNPSILKQLENCLFSKVFDYCREIYAPESERIKKIMSLCQKITSPVDSSATQKEFKSKVAVIFEKEEIFKNELIKCFDNISK